MRKSMGVSDPGSNWAIIYTSGGVHLERSWMGETASILTGTQYGIEAAQVISVLCLNNHHPLTTGFYRVILFNLCRNEIRMPA